MARFDGDLWTIFSTSNSSIPENFISCIEIDKLNNVWVATSGGHGIALFDGSSWNMINDDNSGLSANHINTIFVDNNNVKWIGAQRNDDDQISGLNKYDDDSWELFNSSNSGIPLNIYYPSVPNDLVEAINVDRNGTVWIGVWGGGLAAYDNTGLAKHFVPLWETIHYSKENEPIIYPNPSDGVFNITNINEIEYLEVINLNGQIIYKEKFNNKNSNSIQIQLYNATKGFYIVRLIGNSDIRSEIIIIK